MAQQLAYVIVTPYTISKSRTGGVLARLISRSGLELAAARMMGPSRELVEEYAQQIVSANDDQNKGIQELIREYILRSLGPDPRTGRRRRVMLLLFQGEDAVRRIRAVVGTFKPDGRAGETIRDTYGDLIVDGQDQVRYFEPAVLAAPTPEEVETKLKLWARYSDADGGLLRGSVAYPAGATPEQTLVLIKPDNFRFPNVRPGNVIDFFSRTGLYIIGIKVHRMSVAEALEFYGPVKDILRSKFNAPIGAQAKAALEKALGFPIPPAVEARVGELLGPVFGDHQFGNIVKFMTGLSPQDADVSRGQQPGTEKCLALVYEGVDAVRKIRDVLGPTDPAKAPPGSVRREFGQTVMINAAHASDSVDNARREMNIIRISDNTFKHVVESFYAKLD